MNTDRDLIGLRVRQARKAARLTQDQVGWSVGLTRASIANIEAGRQGVLFETAIQLARTLGVTPDYLAGIPAGKRT